MANKLLWITLITCGIVYSYSTRMIVWDNEIKESIYLSDKVQDDLSLIKSSPRWKFPYGDFNASIDNDFNYVFPESSIPIISLEIEKDDFFSFSEGIYIEGEGGMKSRSNDMRWWQYPANYKKRGSDWQREAKISFYGFSEEIADQIIGIRINGNATRAFPQKSLRLVFNDTPIKDYFFKSGTEYFNTLLLRNGGNDWDRAFLRDILSQNMSKGLSLETQDAKAVHLYLNGEYWGIHFLRPKIDDDYIAAKYDLKKKNVSIIESPLNIYRGDSSGLTVFKSLIEFAKTNDLSVSINYKYMESQLDIMSFIDYLHVQLFIVNTDWPQNNWMLWKDLSNTVNQGKWKWILKDTDYGLGFFDSKAYAVDMLKKVDQNNGAIGILFTSLMENEEFAKFFQLRGEHILMSEWSENNFNQKLDSIQAYLLPEMQYQIKRWRTHISISDWENEVQEVRDFYAHRIVEINRKDI